MISSNSHWSSKPIKEVGKVVTGTTPSKSQDEYYGGNVPFVTPGELGFIEPVKEAATYLSELGAEKAKTIPKNSVMVCCIGSLGKIGIAGRELATNQQINSIIFDETQVDPRYGFRYCQTLQPLLEQIAPSTTIAIVNKSRFESIEIPVPPLAEQQRIAAILDKADALRAKRRAALAKLDTLLQATFLHLFGDPVTNPMRWDVRPLGELGDGKTGIVDGPFGSAINVREDYTDLGEIPVIRTKNVNDFRFITEDLKFITTEKFETVKRSEVLPGDVILTKVGTIGNLCIFPTVFERAVLSTTGSCRIRVNPKKINRTYLLHYLHNYKPEMLRIASTGVQAFLNMKHIKSFKVPLPDMKLQIIFEEKEQLISKSRQYHQDSLIQLDNLFHAVQQRAFKGLL